MTKDEIDAALGRLTRYEEKGDYSGSYWVVPDEAGEYVRFEDVRELLESIDAARLAGRKEC